MCLEYPYILILSTVCLSTTHIKYFFMRDLLKVCYAFLLVHCSPFSLYFAFFYCTDCLRTITLNKYPVINHSWRFTMKCYNIALIFECLQEVYVSEHVLLHKICKRTHDYKIAVFIIFTAVIGSTWLYMKIATDLKKLPITFTIISVLFCKIFSSFVYCILLYAMHYASNNVHINH